MGAEVVAGVGGGRGAKKIRLSLKERIFQEKSKRNKLDACVLSFLLSTQPECIPGTWYG